MLAQSGKEVIVVDRDESKIKEMRQYTECAFVTENLSAETLKEIGIQNCDVVIDGVYVGLFFTQHYDAMVSAFQSAVG